MLDDKDKAVIAWAEIITYNTELTSAAGEAAFQRLKKHFSESEIVEITLASALFNMLNRLKRAFGVEVEDAHQVQRFADNPQVDFAALHDYLQQSQHIISKYVQ